MSHKKPGGKKDTNENMSHGQIMGKGNKSGNPKKDDHNPQFQNDKADIETRSEEGSSRPPGKHSGSGR